MNNWLHKVQYYETDQMQIVHHSNYIRWFEEARTYLMEQIDFGYDKMEEQGIVVPVLAVQADYKSMSRFGDTVEVRAHIEEFTGVKMIIAYEIVDQSTGDVRCTGETKHAFLDKETYRPLSLKRKHKNLFDLFNQLKDSKEED